MMTEENFVVKLNSLQKTLHARQKQRKIKSFKLMEIHFNGTHYYEMID